MSDDDESVGGESDIWTEYGEEVTILLLELEAKVREVVTITEKAPTRGKLSHLRNYLRHYAKLVLTHGIK